MNTALTQSYVVARILLAFLVVIVAGFWGLLTLFSDAPAWSAGTRILYFVGGHVLAGFAVGMLLPLRWRLSIAAAWGSLLMGIGGLLAMARSAGIDTERASSLASRYLFPLLTLFGLPAAAGLGGYLGSSVVARWSRHSGSRAGPGAISNAS